MDGGREEGGRESCCLPRGGGGWRRRKVKVDGHVRHVPVCMRMHGGSGRCGRWREDADPRSAASSSDASSSTASCLPTPTLGFLSAVLCFLPQARVVLLLLLLLLFRLSARINKVRIAAHMQGLRFKRQRARSSVCLVRQEQCV